jgi:hypothetical protein
VAQACPLNFARKTGAVRNLAGLLSLQKSGHCGNDHLRCQDLALHRHSFNLVSWRECSLKFGERLDGGVRIREETLKRKLDGKMDTQSA